MKLFKESLTQELKRKTNPNNNYYYISLFYIGKDKQGTISHVLVKKESFQIAHKLIKREPATAQSERHFIPIVSDPPIASWGKQPAGSVSQLRFQLATCTFTLADFPPFLTKQRHYNLGGSLPPINCLSFILEIMIYLWHERKYKYFIAFINLSYL